MKANLSLLAAAASLLAVPAAAQTASAPPAATLPTKPTKVQDVRYLSIETLTPKPGAALWKLMSEKLIPAAKAAGLPVPVVYHAETGAPHTIVITELTGGLQDLEYEYTAEDVKFMAALAKQEGGAEKAFAVMKQYTDSIETRSREIVHLHTK